MPRYECPGVVEAPPCEKTTDEVRPKIGILGCEVGAVAASREPTLAVLNMVKSFAENDGLSRAACAGKNGKLDW